MGRICAEGDLALCKENLKRSFPVGVCLLPEGDFCKAIATIAPLNSTQTQADCQNQSSPPLYDS